ncbi:hypothetical protein [Streptacidiphilus sp. EB103A]|uniref:hypothetical protein n=1 Tax=Streptacidiphilus sp. EB103A TaxID=3156275 RepID=UPI0035132193
MADLSEEQLLHLVDRAETGSLLAEEAVMLRAGIRSLAAARRSLGGMQAKQQREAQEQIGACCDHARFRHWQLIGRCCASGCGCHAFVTN